MERERKCASKNKYWSAVCQKLVNENVRTIVLSTLLFKMYRIMKVTFITKLKYVGAKKSVKHVSALQHRSHHIIHKK